MLTFLLILAALFVGAALGMFIMALCIAGARSDRRFQQSIDEYVKERR